MDSIVTTVIALFIVIGIGLFQGRKIYFKSKTKKLRVMATGTDKTKGVKRTTSTLKRKHRQVSHIRRVK